ncbi:MAG: hypothetical protein KDA81_22300, partial [Planctomycetaceae bacterium]|nr:hypothetical protein [Planctomycetaceae bacterium]
GSAEKVSVKLGVPTPAHAGLESNADHSERAVNEQVGEQQEELPPGRYRLPDDRPALNENRLKELGIHVYRSDRLVLLTDVDADQVATIPLMADQLFTVLEGYFGPLPPSPEQSSFQVTGCLMRNVERFRAAGLMPSEEFSFEHGRHHHYQFWMFNPEQEYYRRHLAFHEFVHCFMTCECGMIDTPPNWYIEGMAEYFATHSLSRDETGKTMLEFSVMPSQYDGYEGWGRITQLRKQAGFVRTPATAADEIQELNIRPFRQAVAVEPGPALKQLDYSEAWAVCWFLNVHPGFQEHWEPLRHMRTFRSFTAAAEAAFEQLGSLAEADWLLFSETICEGFDPERCFPVHRPDAEAGEYLSESQSFEFDVRSDRDWQESPVRLRAGNRVRIMGAGRCQIRGGSEIWETEPQGISIDFFKGIPLGTLVCTFVSADGRKISNRLPVGREMVIAAPYDSVLWFQINDSSGSRADNEGSFQVTATAADF